MSVDFSLLVPDMLLAALGFLVLAVDLVLPQDRPARRNTAAAAVIAEVGGTFMHPDFRLSEPPAHEHGDRGPNGDVERGDPEGTGGSEHGGHDHSGHEHGDRERSAAR